jgi:hypothetical protein
MWSRLYGAYKGALNIKMLDDDTWTVVAAQPCAVRSMLI